MLTLKVLTAAGGLLALAPAIGQEAAPVANTIPAAAEKKVCRSEQVTGSMMPKRTCHTRADWAAIDQANATVVQNMRNRTVDGSAH